MRRFEDCNAIWSSDNSLAVDHERAGRERERGGRDDWKSIGPIKGTSREQPHAIAVAPDLESKPIVLDFMYPSGPARRFVRGNGVTRADKLGGQHAALAHTSMV